MTPELELKYFFDPLCGWCYAAAPAVKRLADTYGRQLTMIPTGLFVAPRPVAAISDHAWTNDRRIGKMTGQTFTEAYHRNVLLAPNGVFSSQALTRALVALGEIDPALEPQFLHAAQIARYVAGRDTSRTEVVVPIAAEVARAGGHIVDLDLFHARLDGDTVLRGATDQRIAEGQRQMDALAIRGVPQLVVTDRTGTRIIDSRALYAGGDAALTALGNTVLHSKGKSS